MSALFSPIKLRGLALPNRIMVAPMCQYSAENGEANDWHFTHINTLALSGAAMFCIEATHVEAIGRITPGCLGLWNDATEAALKPILTSVRKHSRIAVAMQLAHAGRKGSSHTPWGRGQQIPLAEGGWQTEGPSAAPHKEGELVPLACGGAKARARRIRCRRQTRRAAGYRRYRAA
jgi:NADPH2 dehydrogenase